MVNVWTRDDLPSAGEARDVFMETPFGASGFEAMLDAVVAHLNANGELAAAPSPRTTTTADLATSDRWKAAFKAANEALRLAERERDEALFQRDVHACRTRAEDAEARTAPAVTKADIEQAVAEWVDDAPEIVNEVWSLVSGADPAVFVVRESDVAAVKVTEAGQFRWSTLR